jgi:hypothetical protein
MKTYYLTLSQFFPVTHAKAGLPTYFEEQFLQGVKSHTIRANYAFWKKRFEQIADGKACLSIRQWVGKPYSKGSTQREIARLTREDGIGIQKLEFVDGKLGLGRIGIVYQRKHELAKRDGLSFEDWQEWFRHYDLTKPMAIIHFTSFRY